jgi:putative ABC transport system permease protein
MSAAAKRPSLRSVVFVAVKDLTNEKLITACLVLSVVAVLTPILLLTSVKVGFIDRLRSEFIEDPSFREIRPVAADLRQDDYFAEIGAWEGVIYTMPSVMLTPREVDYVTTGENRSRGSAKLFPSAPNDPLFDKLVGRPPEGDNVVVSADVARDAKLEIGSPIELSVSRVEDDKRKRVSIAATVVGIVPEERVLQPTIFADRVIDRQVESYRAGIAVPERGWPGAATVPNQSFDAIVIIAEEPLGEAALSSVRIRIGAGELEPVDAAAALAVAAGEAMAVDPRLLAEHAGRSFYLIRQDGRLYSGEDVKEVADVLRNEFVQVAGVNAPLAAEIAGRQAPIVGLDPRLFPDIVDLAAEWQIRNQAAYGLNDGVYFPESLRADWEAAGAPPAVRARVALPEGSVTDAIEVQVRNLGFVAGDAVVASPILLAMLSRGRAIPLDFDFTSNSIVEESAGYRGFRVVADDIESVPGLVERFVDAGTQVRAKSDEILKLQRLERSLDILILVVAAVALAGGFAILSSSFFANVQRKRVAFATIRLIGMRKISVFQIPLAQAAIVAALGIALSFVSYVLVSAFLNRVIAAQLSFDGQLSKLYAVHFVVVGAFVLVASMFASLAASREATRIDPAQAIRGE